MTRASLAAFRQTITVAWPQHAERDAKALLIRTAKEGHARIMREQTARGGFPPSFEAFANQPGRPVEAVVLPGPIVYKYGYVREVIVAIKAALLAASPRKSGRYQKGHMLFVNGVPVAAIPAQIPAGADLMYANIEPYARRLEIGKTESGRDFLIQVPNRIYERVAKKMQSRFGNVAKIEFSYATIPNSYVIKGKLASHYWTSTDTRTRVLRKRQQHRWVGKQVQSPAIVIRML